MWLESETSISMKSHHCNPSHYAVNYITHLFQKKDSRSIQRYGKCSVKVTDIKASYYHRFLVFQPYINLEKLDPCCVEYIKLSYLLYNGFIL